MGRPTLRFSFVRLPSSQPLLVRDQCRSGQARRRSDVLQRSRPSVIDSETTENHRLRRRSPRSIPIGEETQLFLVLAGFEAFSAAAWANAARRTASSSELVHCSTPAFFRRVLFFSTPPSLPDPLARNTTGTRRRA